MAIVGVGLAVLVLPGSSLLNPASRAAWFSVSLEAANGSGCRTPATVTAQRTRDGSGLAVTYRRFQTSGGASTNCQLMVRVRTAKGRTYAIETITNRGRANLGSTASARHTFTSYFTGEDSTLVSRHDIGGPRHGSWRTVDLIRGHERHWAPCGRASLLNINNVLRVTGPASESTDLTATVFHLTSAVCR